MQKYLFLLLSALSLFSCTNPKKVWEVSLGESKSEVEATLENKGYSYHTKDGKLNIETSIAYLGIRWDGISFDFEEDSLNTISFRMIKGEKLTEEQKKDVVRELDKIYGDHTVDDSAKEQYGTIAWKWKKIT